MRKKIIFRSDTTILFLLVLPAIMYYIIFHYVTIAGLAIAFVDFNPGKGIFQSQWVGLQWFKQFFNSMFFTRTFRNTILLSSYHILFGFPIPILFALLLNEVKNRIFKKVVQTVSFFPHFIALVVVVGMMYTFLSKDEGIINYFIKMLGGEPTDFLSDPKWFRTLFVSSSVWQEFGYSSILYLASLATIDPQLYNAAEVDGANRFQKILHITIPGISQTAIIVLLLSLGRIMSVSFEKVLLMYSPSIYETADVISTYVYRRGILGSEYSFATSVGLFNSIVNFAFLLFFNRLAKRYSNFSIF